MSRQIEDVAGAEIPKVAAVAQKVREVDIYLKTWSTCCARHNISPPPEQRVNNSSPCH